MSEAGDAPTAALRLGATLDLKAAAPLLADLLAARGADLTIDASDVRRLGAQCLQVLLSASETWARDGHSYEIVEPSAAFIEGLALMGATHALGVAETLPETVA